MRRFTRIPARALRALLACAGLIGFAPAAVAQVEGSLDPGFGAVTIQTLRPASLTYSASALQPDGKLLLTGVGSTADAQCAQRSSTAIARLNPDGSLDAGFGDLASPGRTVLLGFCQEILDLRALALQADGKILLGGGRTYANGRSEAVVIRLNPDGSIDGSFGVAGLATLLRPINLAPSDRVHGLVVLPGSPLRILAVGGGSDTAGTAAIAFVLDAQGQLVEAGNHQDPGGPRYRRETVSRPAVFCGSLFDQVRVGASANSVYAAALAACQDQPGQPLEFATVLFRFDPLAGSPAERAAFAFDPAAVLDANGFQTGGANLNIGAMEFDAGAGRIWLAGAQVPLASPPRSGVAALDLNLQPDTRVLGGDGRHLVAISGYVVDAFVTQPDGRLVLAGKLLDVNGWLGVHRLFASSGAPDNSFGPDVPSLAILPQPTPNPVAYGLHRVPSNGRLLLAAASAANGASGQLIAFGLVGRSGLFASGFE